MTTIEQFFGLESYVNPSFIRDPLYRAADRDFSLVYRALQSTPPVEKTYRGGFMWRKRRVCFVLRLNDVIARIHELKKALRAKGRT